MTHNPDKSFGHYKLQSAIGSGGMGEVFLAEDTRLARLVAVKFLAEEFSRDPDRLRRFVQEARAASALNHPNIITIHEIGETDEKHFIATEYINGETLRARLENDRLQLSEVLSVAVQTAEALAAAHAAGIVHRDIKPENIMLRGDGYVKVLDFGLAKLTERQTPALDSEAQTRALQKTADGVVLGTLAYMSPEQSRGKPVDERTDIWSLGVVIYEMLAGHTPFAGETMSDIIAAIIKSEPPPIESKEEEIPHELQRIVRKILRKNADERYQTAKDLLIDLKTLRRDLDLQDALERTIPPARKNAPTQTITDSAVNTPTQIINTTTGAENSPHTTSSAEYLAGKIKRHKFGVIVASVLLVVALAGIGYGVYKFTAKQNAPASSLSAMKLARLTASGKVTLAAISSDGRYAVHVVDDGGQQSLWMRQTATQSNVQIVAPAKVRYSGLTFSIDGNYIFYVKREEGGGTIRSLYQTPVLGGSARKVWDDVDSPVTFSPDGKQFAFVRVNGVQGETSLFIANTDGSGERKLAAHTEPENFESNGAAWSPDGKTIVCGIYRPATVSGLMEVSVESGAERLIDTHRWGSVGQVAALPDGSGFIIDAADESTGYFFQMWFVPREGGEPRRITNDLSNYQGASLTADANTLLTVQSEVSSNLWVAPDGDANRARQITSGKYGGDLGIGWTPDNRIVYANRDFNIMITETDGSNQKLLFGEHDSRFVGVSPDNRYIVFESWRDGGLPEADDGQIWRADIDGANPKRLTNGKGWNSVPQISPDGKWVVYQSSASNKTTIWKVSIDGGEAAQMTSEFSLAPMVSPDGKMISYIFRRDQEPFKVAIASFENGQLIKEFDIAKLSNQDSSRWLPRWSPDGRALHFTVSRNGVSNLWSQPTDGGEPKQITDFKSDRIFSFDWSRDGKQLAAARGTVNKDAVLISNFR